MGVAVAGDHVGIQFRKMKNGMMGNGMLLVKSGCVQPAIHFQGTCYFLTKSEGGRSKPFLTGYIQKLHVET